MSPQLEIGKVGEITVNASLIFKTGTKNSPTTHKLFIACKSTLESLTKTVRLAIVRNIITSEFLKRHIVLEQAFSRFNTQWERGAASAQRIRYFGLR